MQLSPRTTLVAVTLAAALLTGAARGADVGVDGPHLPTKPMGAQDAGAVDAAATKTFAGLGANSPGLYVGVWDPHKGMFTKAYGKAVIDGADAEIGDALRVGSLTTSYTATVVLQLVAEGKVSLDGTIADYLPDLVRRSRDLAPITVRQLLTMQSGIPDHLDVPGSVTAGVAADPARVWTDRELVLAGVGAGLQPPGTKGYSTTNAVVLQMIAEQAAGKPLASLIAAKVAGPLGLGHTRLPAADDRSLPAPAAHGYLNAGCVEELRGKGATGLQVDQDVTGWSPSASQGGGAVVSTLGDLGVWAASLSGNSLLPKGLGFARLDTHDIGDGIQYGQGIMRFGAWFGHVGEAFGYQVLALHNPATGVTFVAAANACNGTLGSLAELLDTLYPHP